VVRIQGPSIHTHIPLVAEVLELCLPAHVAGCTQGLQFTAPKQFLIALVGNNMIDMVAGSELARGLAHHAEGVFLQVEQTSPHPPPSVIEVVPATLPIHVRILPKRRGDARGKDNPSVPKPLRISNRGPRSHASINNGAAHQKPLNPKTESRISVEIQRIAAGLRY
jgi:hypothetical protein